MSVKDIFENMDYGPAPESRAMAMDWLESHRKKFKHYIAGRWQSPLSKKYFDSVNPCNRDVLARIPHGNKRDVNKAVAAAKSAFPAWSALSGHQRARFLYNIARHIQKNARLLAVLESLDNGKTIRESRDIDIPLAARHFYHHAGWAQLMDSEFREFEPLGVAGQIIPWNFPLLMLAWKIAPAIATGNTVVLKPAEYTSITALLFAEICQQIGLPEGVVNIVTGDGETGAFLVDHPEINKIAFTGSTEVGRIIRQKTAGTGKKLSLELGGKSPFIVFEDADLDSAVEGVVDAIWFNQGQVCCAGSRLLVQENIAKKFYGKLKKRMEKLRVGDALDKATDMGAIVSPAQLDTISQLVKQGVSEGSELWQPSWACPSDGYFYPPTLFTGVAPSSTISQVEIFGPVLVATSFRTPQEAVSLANNTRYGLAASVWTENINMALDIAPRIKAGTVWINSTNVFDAASGFGGYRESGFGREGGREGLFEYVRPRLEGDLAVKPVHYKSNLHSRQSTVTPKAFGGNSGPEIDRTAKMYIGGKQVRPDGGYSLPVNGPHGMVGQVSQGNRKDIRNAVEAAHACKQWPDMTGHSRAQVLYYLAENLQARAQEFTDRIRLMTGIKPDEAQEEVTLAIQRIFYYAAQSDKYDGQVHRTIQRNVTMAMPEPIGVMGIICPDEFPLLGLISTVIPAIAMGNTIVAIPSETAPLSATDLYQVMDTSDIPGGVINIITGKKSELLPALAGHDDVEGLWVFGDPAGSKLAEQLSTGNMKRTWVNHGKYRNWTDPQQGEGSEFLRHATQLKNIWIPYGG